MDEGVKDYQSTGDSQLTRSPSARDTRRRIHIAHESSMWLPSGIYLRLPVQTRCMTRRSIRLGLRMHALILHVRAHLEPPRLLRPRLGVLPRWIKRPLMAWRDHVEMVLSKSRVVLDDRVGVGRAVCHVAPSRSVTRDQGCPHRQTIASVYTMFNVYYLKLLELGLRRDSTPT